MIKKLATFVFAIVPSLLILFGTLSPALAVSVNYNDLIEDGNFDNYNSMSTTQINNFLNGFSSSCISTHKGFTAPDPTGYSPGTSFTYGANVSAGQIIHDAAQAYQINPQVLLATMQKEQSLVTGGGGCSTLGYAAAMGYGCPDSGTTHNYSGVDLYSINGHAVTSVHGTCVNSSHVVGFSRQVIVAAWLLTFDRHRSEGQRSWYISKPGWDNSDDLSTCYEGFMTQGTFYRCPPEVSGSTSATFDGYATIDGSSVHMNNGSTAALYDYTPHKSGNSNFENIYTSWFGSPVSPCGDPGNLASPVGTGHKVISYQYNNDRPTNLAYFEMNDTGSTCAELHVWNPGFTTWLTHIATAMKASNPAGQTVLSMNSSPGSRSTLVDVVYDGSSGHVELHKFSPTLDKFPGYYDVASNLPAVTSSQGMFVSGDFLHKGYDQLAFILYNGSGHVQVHLFDPTLKKAVGYYDVATNLGAITPSDGTFVAGDFLNKGYDQLAYVRYSGTGGHVEVHLFNSSLKEGVGYYDVASNLMGVTSSSGTFVAGDFLHKGYDQLGYIRYAGSGGRVEVHLFNSTLKDGVGYYDVSTNLGAITP